MTMIVTTMTILMTSWCAACSVLTNHDTNLLLLLQICTLDTKY